jgi:hypothetical protein
MAGQTGVVMAYLVRHADGMLCSIPASGSARELDAYYQPLAGASTSWPRPSRRRTSGCRRCHLVDHAGQNSVFLES